MKKIIDLRNKKVLIEAYIYNYLILNSPLIVGNISKMFATLCV